MAVLRKHVDLASRLRKDILTGIYGTEGGLPEGREIATKEGLALNTVVAALSYLEGGGVIEKRGHTYYVNQVSITMTQYVPPAHVRSQTHGRNGYVKNLADVGRTNLPGHLASKLSLAENTQVVFRSRVSGEITEDGTERPLLISCYHYILPISDAQVVLMQAEPHTDILYQVAPVLMTRHDEITPRLPTQEEAKILNISESTPVGHVLIINRDIDGNLLLTQELVLSPRETLIYDYSFENSPK